MMKNCFLGIDTSNYTTSIGILDEQLELVGNFKQPLKVKPGEVGLRQSDAVFSHIKNIPLLLEQIQPLLAHYKVLAVGVSTKPRNQEGSYMPCFLTGYTVAQSIATFLQVPLLEWTHQCGHIMAAIYSAKAFSLLQKEFGAFHVSGGTTELVKANYCSLGFHVEICGGSKDLHAGQLIDRLGVQMGLGFPCGKELEQLALQNTLPIPSKKPSLEGCYMHLSGVENMAMKLLDETKNKELTSAFILNYIGNSLVAIGQEYLRVYGKMPLVFSGGVMSNSILQNQMKTCFDAYFAEPMLSADNAVGVATLTALKFIK